jgi:ribonucleotide monophosphatase NagD (HAD superfamily)
LAGALKKEKEEKMVPGIAFDIDGVFKAGRYFFPEGLKALALCHEAGVPFVFVSNGGGGLGEAEYLNGFKKKLIEVFELIKGGGGGH